MQTEQTYSSHNPKKRTTFYKYGVTFLPEDHNQEDSEVAVLTTLIKLDVK